MSIRQICPQLAVIAREELGEDPARISADLQAIKDWLSKQGHINARTDDQWLIAFLRGCKFSLEKTKEKLDYYYTMRTLVFEIGGISDIRDPKIQGILETGYALPLNVSIPSNGKFVVIWRPGSLDLDKFTFLEATGVMSKFLDLALIYDDNLTIAGYNAIADLSNLSARHFGQLTPSIIKKLTLCLQYGWPIRQKNVYIINAPPGTANVLGIAKKFMSKKTGDRMVVLNDGLESLYQFIPREILPVEYGGNSGTIQDNIDYMRAKLENNRDWFLENAVYKTDESKRPGKPKSHESFFELEGSFRQLNVD